MGAFYRGMRLAAVDGCVLDTPDTSANRAAFGGPVENGRNAGYPQVRPVTLTECGTHARIETALGGFNGGERELAISLAGSANGMRGIIDRGFPGVELRKAYLAAGAHPLIRARSPVAHRPVEHLPDGTYPARMNLAGQKGAHPSPGGVLVRVIEYRIDGGEKVRLLTDLVDPTAYPAAEPAALHHRGWEAEPAFRQIKTLRRGPAEVLRSGDPDLVRQEVWAHLIVHHCLTQVVMHLADDNGIVPAQRRPSWPAIGPTTPTTTAPRHRTGRSDVPARPALIAPTQPWRRPDTIRSGSCSAGRLGAAMHCGGTSSDIAIRDL